MTLPVNKSIFKMVLLLVLCLFQTGCDSVDDTPDLAQESLSVAQVRESMRANFASIDQYSQRNNLAFDSPEAIRSGTLEYSARVLDSATLVKVQSFIEEPRSRSALRSASTNPGLPENVWTIAQKIQTRANNPDLSFDEFIQSLNSDSEYVTTQDWSDSDKKKALVYIAAIQETMLYMDSHYHYDSDGSSGSTANRSAALPPNWRCGLGVAGGALGGALAVFELGPLGWILGGAAGGMLGAAEFC